MATTSDTTPPSSACNILSRAHTEDSTSKKIDFAEPTWWRDALDHEDPNWEDPFELTESGDVRNPSWWRPWKPGDPDRLRFPPIKEIFDHQTRKQQRRSQATLTNVTEQKGGQGPVQGAGTGRAQVSTIKPTTNPRRSARIKAQNDMLSGIARRRTPVKLGREGMCRLIEKRRG